MARRALEFLIAVSIAFGAFLLSFQTHIGFQVESEPPDDWFYRQRAFPLCHIDPEQVARARTQAKALQKATGSQQGSAPWRQDGPSNIGGRITSLVISRQNPDLLYAGAAAGGVMKTVDGGVHWTPLFD